MLIRDKAGSASGTVMHLPDKHGKVEFDAEGIAHEINDAQAQFLLKTFPNQFEEHTEPEGEKAEKFSGEIVIEVTTHAGALLDKRTVTVTGGFASIAVNEPPRPPQAVGTAERSEHLANTLETIRAELAQALAENVRLARDNAAQQVQIADMSAAAKPADDPPKPETANPETGKEPDSTPAAPRGPGGRR